MAASCSHAGSFHRYGDSDPVPDRVRTADSVSVASCSCGKAVIRFHHPATTTHPGRVFAVAYLTLRDCANIGEDVLQALEFCRHNIQCSGKHS
jgi:hypothetical protein